MVLGKKLSGLPWLAIIFSISVFLRIAAALVLGNQVVAMPGIHDQISYHTLATQIIQGKGYSFPENWYPFTLANTPTSHWSFIYPLYLSAVYLLVGVNPIVARILQAILTGILSCLLVYRITTKLANTTVGLISAGLTAVYGYFIYYNAALMTEPFFILGILSVIYITLKLIEAPSLLLWILLGILLGISIMLRQTALFLAPLMIVWILFELRGRVAFARLWWHPLLTLAVIAAFILPWTVRNYARFGTFLLTNSNSGYALYASTHPQLGTVWPESTDEVVVPIPDELKPLNEAQKDRALNQLAMENVLADPGRIIQLSLSKSLEYFKFWPSPTSSILSSLIRTLSFGLYLPFMLVGLVLSLKSWRKFVPLYLVCLCFAGLHILSWPAPRYRLPSDAVMMVFAGMAVVRLYQIFYFRRKPALDLSKERVS